METGFGPNARVLGGARSGGHQLIGQLPLSVDLVYEERQAAPLELVAGGKPQLDQMPHRSSVHGQVGWDVVGDLDERNWSVSLDRHLDNDRLTHPAMCGCRSGDSQLGFSGRSTSHGRLIQTPLLGYQHDWWLQLTIVAHLNQAAVFDVGRQVHMTQTGR